MTRSEVNGAYAYLNQPEEEPQAGDTHLSIAEFCQLSHADKFEYLISIENKNEWEKALYWIVWEREEGNIRTDLSMIPSQFMAHIESYLSWEMSGGEAPVIEVGSIEGEAA